MPKPAAKTQIAIPPPDIRTMTVNVIGDSPLIVHKFSEKSKKQMEDKTQKKARAKEARDPKAEFEAARYRLANGKDGFPCSGFKLAMVSACRFTSGVPMTLARGAVLVMGDYAEIKGKPTMREDIGRVGNFGAKKAMVIYRPEFKNWSTRLTIRYNAQVISLEQIVNLLTIAGFSVGVGDWRPEKNGTFGTFHVEAA